MEQLEKYTLDEVIKYMENKSKINDKLKIALNIGAVALLCSNPILAGGVSTAFTIAGESIDSLLTKIKKTCQNESKEEEAYNEYDRYQRSKILVAKLAIINTINGLLDPKESLISEWKLKDLTKEELLRVENKEVTEGSHIEGLIEDIIEVSDMKGLEEVFKEKVIENYKILLNKLSLESRIFNAYLNGYDEKESNDYSEYCQTLKEFEEELKSNTTLSLSLNFFDYKDDEFKKNSLNKLEEKAVYIQARHREEALLYMMYLIKNENADKIKDTYIIRSYENWERLRKVVKGKILIPYFDMENLDPIAGNTCIFSYSLDDFLDKQDRTIKLKERTQSEMIESVEKETGEYNSEIVRKTNGLFASFKRIIFEGRLGQPKWVEKEELEILIPALLVGEWNEGKKDQEIIEKLSKLNYKDYEKRIKGLIGIQDPFLKNNSMNGNYKLANLEEAWESLRSEVLVEDRKKLKKIAVEIFEEVPKVYSKKEKYSFVTSEEMGEYSVSIKKGIIITLIQLAKNNQCEVDLIVGEILEKITTREEWFMISDYISLLVEASPEVVLKALEEEVEKKESEFWKLFLEKSEDIMFGKNYYTNILWTLEKLLYKLLPLGNLEERDFRLRAIKVLAKLVNKKFEYSINNTPFNSLKNILISWRDIANLGVGEKIKIFKYLFNNFSFRKKLMDLLPTRTRRGSVTDGSKPRYLLYQEDRKVLSRKDVFDTYKGYTEIVIDSAGNDLKVWQGVILKGTFWDLELEEICLEGVQRALKNNKSDQEKLIFQIKLGREIYRNLFYKKAVWALKEEQVKKLRENIFDEINFENKLYNHLYSFTKEGLEFSQIIDMDDLREDRDENSRRLKEQRKEEILSIGIEGDFDRLIKFLSILNKNVEDEYLENTKEKIGAIIAELGNGIIDDNFIKRMEEINERIIVIGYSLRIYKRIGVNIEYLSELVDKIKDSKTKVDILLQLDISSDILDLLENFSEGIREDYWKKQYRVFWCDEDLLSLRVWDELLKYNNFFGIKNLPKEILGKNPMKCLETLEKIKEYNREGNQLNNIYSDDIEKIFKYLYQKEDYNEEETQRISLLEWFFFNNFKSLYETKVTPKYMKIEIEKAPEIIAELISYAYKKDNGEAKELDEKGNIIARNTYDILQGLGFTPCAGEENYQVVKEWYDKFLELIKGNGQTRIGEGVLGRLFSYSFDTKSGNFQSSNIGKIYERVATKETNEGLYIAILNQRGVHGETYGKKELELSEKYKKFSKALELEQSKLSKALKMISESYLYDSKRAQESDLYGI